MKKSKIILTGIATAVMFAIAALLSGCGGGGGGGTTPQVASTPGYGPLKVAMKISRADTSRSAGVATGSIVVSVTVSGYYAEDNSEFTPVTAQVTLSASGGNAKIQDLLVPIGVNHLIIAVATYPDGAKATIKAIVPEIKEGVETSVTADSSTTAVANAAIKYAGNNGITLSKVPAAKITEYQETVAAFVAAGIDPTTIAADDIINYADNGSVPSSVTVSPTSATVSLDSSQQFTATVKNKFGIEISATPEWTVEGSIGSVDSNGLFTPSAEGTGSVIATVSYMPPCESDACTQEMSEISGSADVTVVLVACYDDTDCDDSDPLTTDTCTNAGTSQSTCTNTCDIACGSDTECDDGDEYTTDTCTNPGTCSAACENTCIPACSSDEECGTSDSSTIYTCSNPGECSASCSSCSITCNKDTDCDDSIAITADTCFSAGTCDSYCDNSLDTSLVPQLSAYITNDDISTMYYCLVLNDDGSKLFVSDTNGFEMDVIDTAAASQTAAITYSSPPYYCTKDPSRNAAYLLTEAGAMLVSRVSARPSGRQAARSASISQGGTSYWQISKLDMDSETITTIDHSAMFDYGSNILPAISENLDRFYFGQAFATDTESGTYIYSVDLSSFTEGPTITSSANNYGDGSLAIDQESDTLYLAGEQYESCGVECELPYFGVMAVDLNAGSDTGYTGISSEIATYSYFMDMFFDDVSGVPTIYTVQYVYDGVYDNYSVDFYNASDGSEICTAQNPDPEQVLGVFYPFNHVYVYYSDLTVQVLNGSDCSVAATLDVPSKPLFFAADKLNGKVYLSHGYYFITVIEYAPDGTIPVPDNSGVIVPE